MTEQYPQLLGLPADIRNMILDLLWGTQGRHPAISLRWVGVFLVGLGPKHSLGPWYLHAFRQRMIESALGSLRSFLDPEVLSLRRKPPLIHVHFFAQRCPTIKPPGIHVYPAQVTYYQRMLCSFFLCSVTQRVYEIARDSSVTWTSRSVDLSERSPREIGVNLMQPPAVARHIIYSLPVSGPERTRFLLHVQRANQSLKRT